LSDKEKDSEKKIRELASEIVNELLKSGKPVDVNISTGGTAEKCGSNFDLCVEYACKKKFDCTSTNGFGCGKFSDSKDYSISLG